MIKDGQSIVKALKENALGNAFDLNVNIINRKHAAQSQLVLHAGSETDTRVAKFNEYISDPKHEGALKFENKKVTNVTLEDILNYPEEVNETFKNMESGYYNNHFK